MSVALVLCLNIGVDPPDVVKVGFPTRGLRFFVFLVFAVTTDLGFGDRRVSKVAVVPVLVDSVHPGSCLTTRWLEARERWCDLR